MFTKSKSSSKQAKRPAKPAAKLEAKPPPPVSLWFFTTVGLLMALSPLITIAVMSICYVLDQEFGIRKRIGHATAPLKVETQKKKEPEKKKEAEKKKPNKRRLMPRLPEYQLIKVKPGQKPVHKPPQKREAPKPSQPTGQWITLHRAV